MPRYPQRAESHNLEELSERFLRQNLPRNWQPERPAREYGVDLRVDIFEGEAATGLELLFQLKSTDAERLGEYGRVRLKVTTYNYLWDKLQVVMIVKYVQSENEGYWLLLKDVPAPNQNNETFTVRIPRTNKLSEIDWEEIQEYVRGITNSKLAAARRRQVEQR